MKNLNSNALFVLLFFVTRVGTLLGPPGTPYEGGVFKLEIRIPSKYPFEPPKMRFETKIWHPNISSQTGAICLVLRHVHYARVRSRVLSCRVAGHPQRPVVARVDDQDCTAVYFRAAVCRRAHGSTGA